MGVHGGALGEQPRVAVCNYGIMIEIGEKQREHKWAEKEIGRAGAKNPRD